LTLANSVHEFQPSQSDGRRPIGLETQHGAATPLDRPQVTDVERFRAELSQGIPDSIRQACITRLLKAKPGLAEARAKQRANQVKLLDGPIISSMIYVLGGISHHPLISHRIVEDHAEDSERLVDRASAHRPLDMDVLKPEEIAALLEAARPATYRDGKLATNNYRLMISFAVFTGCRVGKILGAAWSPTEWNTGQFQSGRGGWVKP
jgi:integrase